MGIIPLLLYSYSTSTGMVSASGRQIPYISAILPQGDKSKDYNITIKVDIFGQTGASEVDIIVVKASYFILQI